MNKKQRSRKEEYHGYDFAQDAGDGQGQGHGEAQGEDDEGARRGHPARRARAAAARHPGEARHAGKRPGEPAGADAAGDPAPQRHPAALRPGAPEACGVPRAGSRAEGADGEAQDRFGDRAGHARAPGRGQGRRRYA